jgi:hypothetical protein
MAFEDVEKIVFRGDPSDVWLKSIEEDDIVEYLGRRPPAEFHPDVIPLICRFPFQQRENQLFVCQRFLKLLLYSEKFLCSHRDRTDVLVFVAGFMEASGYTAALGQLICHRQLVWHQVWSRRRCLTLTGSWLHCRESLPLATDPERRWARRTLDPRHCSLECWGDIL